MRWPLNLEGAFAVAILLSSALAYARAAKPAALPAEGIQRRAWLFLLLAIPAALLWTASIPLVSDDFVHIVAALNPKPGWFPNLFTVPENNHFYRPLGYIDFILDALWAGRHPAVWHFGNLVLHFANCVLVYLLAIQWGLGRFFAAAAAVIFGIHGSRPEAVTWIAGRFDLIATLFVLATLLLFLRGKYKAALLTALPALLTKETAFVLPLLLVFTGGRPQWKRIAPFAAMAAIVFAIRWHVLSGIGGYSAANNTPAILNFSLLRSANALLLRLWAVLFFPVNWSEGGPWWLWLALGVGVAGYCCVALKAARRTRALQFLALAWITALPAQHLLLLGVDLERSRLLYLPSAGFALFLASTLEALSDAPWRIPAVIAIIVFHLAALEHNLILWRSVAEKAAQTCDRVAASLQGTGGSVTVLDVPVTLHGVYFLSNGMPECVDFRHGIDKARVLDRVAADAATGLTLRWDPASEALRP